MFDHLFVFPGCPEESFCFCLMYQWFIQTSAPFTSLDLNFSWSWSLRNSEEAIPLLHPFEESVAFVCFSGAWHHSPPPVTMSKIYSYCHHYQHRGKLAKLVCDRSNTIFWLMRHLWDKASTKLLQYSYWLRRTSLVFFMNYQIFFLFLPANSWHFLLRWKGC